MLGIVLAVAAVLLGGIFVVGLLNFRPSTRTAENAFKTTDAHRAELYINAIQSQATELSATASLWRRFTPFLDNTAK